MNVKKKFLFKHLHIFSLPNLTALTTKLIPVLHSIVGLFALLGIWQGLSMLLAASPNLQAFTDMAPVPAFKALAVSLANGTLFTHLSSSMSRISIGMALATIGGITIGTAIGLISQLRAFTHIPFQFLRMVSPLAWMPVAVIAFDTWDGAIIFIIAAAATWPILFAVSSAIRRLNPEWMELAHNLGAGHWATLRDFTLPAVAQDIFAGARLALGVAWIVLVPAELLGVTSGMGYALNDARDALEYDKLAAMIIAIGITGFTLDMIMQFLANRWTWRAIS